MSAADANAVLAYLRGLQDRICAALEQADGTAKFVSDQWQRAEGGGGDSRVLRNGSVFEQAGVNFSHVTGAKLPASATAQPTNAIHSTDSPRNEIPSTTDTAGMRYVVDAARVLP